jgi:hypothetical protein
VNHSGSAPNTHVVVTFDNDTDGLGPMIAKYNLGYNPQHDSSRFDYAAKNTNPVVIGSNMFNGATLVGPSKADFRFRTGSRAYEAGNLATSVDVDILGVSRGSKPSMGAYQNPGP